MQVRTSLQTDNHTSTPPLSFLQAGCRSCCPTNSVKALKASVSRKVRYNIGTVTDGREARQRTVPTVLADRSCSTRVRRSSGPGYDSSCRPPPRLHQGTARLGCCCANEEPATPTPGTVDRSPLPTCDRRTRVRSASGCSPRRLHAANPTTQSVSHMAVAIVATLQPVKHR